jgi:hypothetical protein
MTGRSSKQWLLRIATVLAVLGTMLGSAAADEHPKTDAPEVSKLANGGFALDFEIWRPAGKGEPRSLEITYTWGGTTNTLVASRQNDRWHAEFPTQPASNEQAKLLLRYSFDLSDGDRKRINAAETTLVAAILNAIDKASEIDIGARKAANAANAKAAAEKAEAEKAVVKEAENLAKATADLAKAKEGTDKEALVTAASNLEKAKTADEAARARLAAAIQAAEKPVVPAVKFGSNFAASSRAIAESDEARTLKEYGTADQDGLSLLLERLGIAEGKSGWELDPEKKELLARNSSDWVGTDTDSYADDIEDAAKALAPLKSEKECVVPPEPTKLSQAQAQALLEACVRVLGEQPAARVAPLSEDLKAVLTETGESRGMRTDNVLRSSLGKSYAAWAVRLAERTLLRAEVRPNRAKVLEDLLKGLDTAFAENGWEKDGATLIKGAAKPRRYDIATGALYVPQLEDVIVPTLISICAWEGCLDPTEVAWDAPHGWGRAFSIDAGVRLKTLGTQDRRQSDTISFFMGLSVNPVSVLRVSGGMYAFENAQRNDDGDHPWQFVPYVGVTLNVLNAATLLGSLGLNSDLSPTATPVE